MYVMYHSTSAAHHRVVLVTPPLPLRFRHLACREADRKAGFLLKNTRFSTDPATGQKLVSAR